MGDHDARTHVRTHAPTNGFSSRLIVFTRFPTPGTTKTRLIPALGPEGAADLQREMTEHTLGRLRPLSEEKAQIEIRYDGGDEEAMERWLGDDMLYTDQGEGDLGQRMERAFRDAFASGADRAVIVGSDCPGLDLPDVREALALLDDNPVVIGPALDGGYYLIAMGSSAPEPLYETLFTGMPWGSGEVMWRTANALSEAGYDLGLLDEKADVDEPGDLTIWEQVKSRTETLDTATEDKGLGAHPPSLKLWRTGGAGLNISVIIPTCNEEELVGELLGTLGDEDVEIIVADGGSTDRTVALCEESGVRVVRSPRGRARQMNAGAAEATGSILLFLHADTTLPDGWAFRVREVVRRGSVAGAFLFGTDLDTPTMNIIENGAHFRSIRLGIVFGDQAIFATREAFYHAGQYPDQPIMEDHELWKRLGKLGRREIVHLQVRTSGRKWAEKGVWRTTLVNQLITWLYVLGVSSERLVKCYQKLSS